MPRVKKTETPSAKTANKAKATKTKSTKSKTVEAAPVQVVDTVATENNVLDVAHDSAISTENTVVDVAPDSAISTDFTTILVSVQAVVQQINSLKTALRTLEKKAVREIKAATKASKRKQRSKGNRAPSGFVKPTQISNELAAFLGKASGTEMARTEVTKEINAYIRANKLQDPNNGRIIKADAKLQSLLNLKKSDELTYFNLQKYMSPHFAKATKTASA
jgi:chromatin remodeling complex protein RSC6